VLETSEKPAVFLTMIVSSQNAGNTDTFEPSRNQIAHQFAAHSGKVQAQRKKR